MGNTIAAVFLCLSAVSVKGFLSVRLLSALLLLLGLPVKLADKNTPADIGRFLNCRLPLAPLDYGKTCACLFRDITHTQHLHSVILSILVDTFFTRISMPKQHPGIHNISAA